MTNIVLEMFWEKDAIILIDDGDFDSVAGKQVSSTMTNVLNDGTRITGSLEKGWNRTVLSKIEGDIESKSISGSTMWDSGLSEGGPWASKFSDVFSDNEICSEPYFNALPRQKHPSTVEALEPRTNLPPKVNTTNCLSLPAPLPSPSNDYAHIEALFFSSMPAWCYQIVSIDRVAAASHSPALARLEDSLATAGVDPNRACLFFAGPPDILDRILSHGFTLDILADPAPCWPRGLGRSTLSHSGGSGGGGGFWGTRSESPGPRCAFSREALSVAYLCRWGSDSLERMLLCDVLAAHERPERDGRPLRPPPAGARPAGAARRAGAMCRVNGYPPTVFPWYSNDQVRLERRPGRSSGSLGDLEGAPRSSDSLESRSS
jgi:hypothetical protein